MGLVGIPTKRAARVCAWKGACVRAHARVRKEGTKRFNTLANLWDFIFQTFNDFPKRKKKDDGFFFNIS